MLTPPRVRLRTRTLAIGLAAALLAGAACGEMGMATLTSRALAGPVTVFLHSHGDVGAPSWQRRPLEISRAIDAVLADPRWYALPPGRVGMHGMSAGGHTALTQAGGRWSLARLLISEQPPTPAQEAEAQQRIVGFFQRRPPPPSPQAAQALRHPDLMAKTGSSASGCSAKSYYFCSI